MSEQYEVGRVFVIPLLGGGYAFGVITFYDVSLGMFCDVFDHVSDEPEPPPDLAERPLALRDRYVLADFQIKDERRSGARWRLTKMRLSAPVSPSTRWYAMGAPPRPYQRKDLYRELPAEEIDEAQAKSLLQLSTRFPPFRAAEAEVAVKHLDATPDELIDAWRARGESN